VQELRSIGAAGRRNTKAARRRGASCSEHHSCKNHGWNQEGLTWLLLRYPGVQVLKTDAVLDGNGRWQRYGGPWKFLVPYAPLPPPKKRQPHITTTLSPPNCHHQSLEFSASISEPVLGICIILDIDCNFPMTGRNPKHHNVPQGYCFPPTCLSFKAMNRPRYLLCY
jgi:hypothetical protein